jgi:large subunit ribosomal protein L21
MYAIVEIAGQQFKVASGQKIYVHRIAGGEGDAVSFSSVLLVDNDGMVSVGAPKVENAVVNATILSHIKGDKVLVFHKKRRKGYRKLNGHRQRFTQLKIDSININ